MRLGVVGGVLGRHRELSPGGRQAVSVAGWFRRGMGGFRAAGGEMVCRGGVSVRRGAGRWWRDVEGSMPCRCMHRARLDEAQMHGNSTHALGALGGQIGSRRRGRGGVHGHA
jgi:hypothetical protein